MWRTWKGLREETKDDQKKKISCEGKNESINAENIQLLRRELQAGLGWQEAWEGGRASSKGPLIHMPCKKASHTPLREETLGSLTFVVK